MSRMKRYTLSESFERILQGEDEWVSHGDFLDDYKHATLEQRPGLVRDPLPCPKTENQRRWAALFTATAIQLCIINGIPIPAWVKDQKGFLADPWYPEARSERMKQYRRETTPFIFALYNVFAGDDVLSRV